METCLDFDEETQEAVLEKVHHHWEGHGNVAGLKADHYFLASILDPYTSPPCADLPYDWLKSCKTVFKRFDVGKKLAQAVTEINHLVANEGNWGECVPEICYFGYQLPFDPAADCKDSGFFIDEMTKARIKTLLICPDLTWKNSLQKEFPLLYELARHVLVMSIQSADVECLCKAHKVIHTTMRNHLKNSTVFKLIYCYVNLHLLNDNEQGSNDHDNAMVSFLEQGILDHQDKA